MLKTVSFIGSGRVATHLALALSDQLITKQILSRNIENAQILADQVGARAISNIENLVAVDLLVIAVSDRAIGKIAESLKQIQYKNLVVHTSGSTDLQVLKDAGLNAGVLYPLQTFSMEHQVDWKNTPLFIEAVDLNQQKQLLDLAQALSDSCYEYNSQQRLSLHLAAVFACNFTNHCYDIAQQILSEKQVDFQLLMPLISATAQKLTHTSAFENQTGPARRDDTNILEMHQNMLSERVEWQQIYQLMSNSIQKRFQD